jgi:hypothetical protein
VSQIRVGVGLPPFFSIVIANACAFFVLPIFQNDILIGGIEYPKAPCLLSISAQSWYCWSDAQLRHILYHQIDTGVG